MKLRDMKFEEIELLSHTDLTYMLLKEEKTSMTTPLLFKKICDLLEYTESEFESKIGDYYTSLTMDKRFIMLKNGEWDLRDNHSVEIVLDDEEDDEEVEVEEENEDEVETEELEEDLDDVLDDDIDDDLDDLSIVDEDEIEEE